MSTDNPTTALSDGPPSIRPLAAHELTDTHRSASNSVLGLRTPRLTSLEVMTRDGQWWEVADVTTFVVSMATPPITEGPFG